MERGGPRSCSAMLAACLGVLLLTCVGSQANASAIQPVAARLALRGGGENGEVKQAVSGGAEPVAEPVRSLLVTFNVECDSTTPQDTIGVVGSCPELGEWKQVTLMSAKDWPKWTVTTPMCEFYENVQYKYVRVDANGGISAWESGQGKDRHISLVALPKPAKGAQIRVTIDDGKYGAVANAQLHTEEISVPERRNKGSPLQVLPGLVYNLAGAASAVVGSVSQAVGRTAHEVGAAVQRSREKTPSSVRSRKPLAESKHEPTNDLHEQGKLREEEVEAALARAGEKGTETSEPHSQAEDTAQEQGDARLAEAGAAGASTARAAASETKSSSETKGLFARIRRAASKPRISGKNGKKHSPPANGTAQKQAADVSGVEKKQLVPGCAPVDVKRVPSSPPVQQLVPGCKPAVDVTTKDAAKASPARAIQRMPSQLVPGCKPP